MAGDTGDGRVSFGDSVQSAIQTHLDLVTLRALRYLI